MYIQSLAMLPDRFLDLLVIRPEMINMLELEIPHRALTFLEKLPSGVVFPHLQDLGVRPCVQRPYFIENCLGWPESVRVFELAPKLENVSLEGFNPASLHLPWHQPKELRLNNPYFGGRVPYNTARSILRKCTFLKVCMVALDIFFVEVNLNSVTLPHLEVLSITINLNRGTCFFESMELPQLKNITIVAVPETGVFGEFSVDLRPLANLQRTSNFSLQRLVLLYMGIDQDELLDVLLLMRSLTEISLIFVWGLDERFFSSLEDNSDTALLPCLSALSTDWRSFPFPNLRSILESRGYPNDLSTSNPSTVAKLTSLTFTVGASFDQSVFENFEEKGLELKLDRLNSQDPNPEIASKLTPGQE